MVEALGPLLIGPVEHIGSTSVPGLAAKPIIDMLACVDVYDSLDIAALEAIGWVHAPEPDDVRDRKWSFCFPDAAWRTHHLHVVEQSSTGWQTWLAFRDHLRAHPEDAAEYGRIKAALAHDYAADDDRPAYRAGKEPFINAILAGE